MYIGPEESRYLVYALRHPVTKAVRYVGKSSYGIRRPREHLQLSGNKRPCPKDRWAKKLILSGSTPEIVVLRVCASNDEANFAERRFIRQFRERGVILYNLTDGGEGVPGIIQSEETRKKRAAAMRGRAKTAEHRMHLSLAKRGKKMSDLARAHMSASQKGRKHSWETKKKIAAGRLGKKHSEEAKDRISKLATGRVYSQEARAKMSLALSKRVHTEAEKAKRRASLIAYYARTGRKPGIAYDSGCEETHEY